MTTRTSCDLGVTQHVIKPTYDDLWIAGCPKYGNLGTYPNYFDAVGAVVAHVGIPVAVEGEGDE